MREYNINYCDICKKECKGIVYLTDTKTYCVTCGIEKQTEALKQADGMR